MFRKYAVTFILSALVVQVTAVSREEFYRSGDKCFFGDDGFSPSPISLDPPLPYYGREYDNCVVHSNGIIEVGNDINPMAREFKNDTFQNHDYTFIAPFYGDVYAGGDTSCDEGVVKYSDEVTKDTAALNNATMQIQNAFPDHTEFSPEYLVVATWDTVGYYENKTDKLNTFQCVIATDGTTSFAIFLYNETEWTTADDGLGPAQVGFNDYRDMDFNQSCEMPCSGTTGIAQLVNTSNVGTPGLWIFRIDGENIIPAEDSCENDTLCSCLTDDPQKQCLCQESKEKVCMADDTPVSTTTPPTTTPPTLTPSMTPMTTTFPTLTPSMTPTTTGVSPSGLGADSTHTLLFMVFSVAIIVSVACVCLRVVPMLRSMGPKVKGE